MEEGAGQNPCIKQRQSAATLFLMSCVQIALSIECDWLYFAAWVLELPGAACHFVSVCISGFDQDNHYHYMATGKKLCE